MKLDPVLNWAERRTFWTMTAGFTTGEGVGLLLQDHWWGWLVLTPGLILTAIRPAGTHLRRRALRREVRKILDDNKKVNHE